MKAILKYLIFGCTSLTLVFISCSKDEEPDKTNDPAAAASITLLQGNGQSAEVETALTSPVEVFVKDQNGDAFAGTTVNFEVTEGSVSSGTAKTGADGKATIYWTLGTSVSTQTLTVSALKADGTTALNGSPLSVTATATAAAPLLAESIALVSGDGQTAPIETVLPNAIEVMVHDQNGDPFEGTTVYFDVTEGSVSSATATTDVDGKTSINWTFGASIGAQTLTITAFKEDGTTALIDSPLSVTATATASNGTSLAERLLFFTGANQSSIVETVLSNPIVMKVVDQNGDAVAGTNVYFTVTEGSVSSATVTTDADGKASVDWTLGASIGTQTLTVAAFKADGTTALVDSPFSITAIATAVDAESIELLSGGGQTAVVGTTLPNEVEVMVKDLNGNGFAGRTVYFTVTEGSTLLATATTDFTGKASVDWTIGNSLGTQTLTVTAFKADGTTSLTGSPLSVTATATVSTGSLAIGDFHEGGVIFYLDGTGEYGLLCAVSDQSANAEWGCPSIAVSGAEGTAIGTGVQNTMDIEAGCATVGTAADVCANLTLNGYSDWFLPSIDELNEMYLNKAAINAMAAANGGSDFDETSRYWSSTQYFASTLANFLYMGNGFIFTETKDGAYPVRAVRAF